MALTRCFVHLLAPETASAAELLGKLNSFLFAHLPTSQFVTLFYGICDPRTSRIEYSSAGHRPPILIGCSPTADRYLEVARGFPLKIVAEEAEYRDQEVWLDRGERLLLYTDGIPEARDDSGAFFGSSRLLHSAAEAANDTPQGVVDSVNRALTRFRKGVLLNDDVSMLVVANIARSRPRASPPDEQQDRNA